MKTYKEVAGYEENIPTVTQEKKEHTRFFSKKKDNWW